MQKILGLLSVLLVVSCYNTEHNCKDFKTGKFTSETTVEGKKFTSTFERNDSIQIENLKSAVAENKLPQALIFSGPSSLRYLSKSSRSLEPLAKAKPSLSKPLNT